MEKSIHTVKGIINIKKLNYDGLNKMMIRNEIAEIVANNLGINQIEISHEANGKPFIDKHFGYNISISHSENWMAVYMSKDHPIGIDIEVEKDAIQKIKNQFINQTEIDIFKSFSISYLHIIWGTKEAIFKYLSGKIQSLQNDITVTNIDYRKQKIEAIALDEHINCKFEILEEEVYLVYC